MFSVQAEVFVSAACVEAVCGPGATSEGPAVPDHRHHFQEDRQAWGHLLGRDEALWSHVSRHYVICQHLCIS